MANVMKQKEKEINLISKKKIKIVEKNGDQLQYLLTTADPWGELPCERKDCLPCQASDKETVICRKRNTVYKNTFNTCKKKGTGSYYSRSLYERFQEHARDCLTKSETSHMLKHLQQDHPEQEEPEYRKELSKLFTPIVIRKQSKAIT